jgi:hypothetical protein
VIASGFHLSFGMDYFVFPKALWREIPDSLAVGRAGWDNWPVFQARFLKALVIDATPVVMAVHQNHDYSHHPGGGDAVYGGEEADRNYRTLGGGQHVFTVLDATHLLTPRGLQTRCQSCYPMCVCKPSSF